MVDLPKCFMVFRIEIHKTSKERELNKNRGTQSLPRIETNRSKQFNTVKSIGDSVANRDEVSAISAEENSEVEDNNSYTKIKKNTSKRRVKSK